jgi:hypothetical protein
MEAVTHRLLGRVDDGFAQHPDPSVFIRVIRGPFLDIFEFVRADRENPTKKASLPNFGNEALQRPRRDLNPQPPDRQSGALTN